MKRAPAPALAYPGEVLLVKGGFAAWRAFALEPPTLPAPGAAPAVAEAYKFRAALNAAMTGRKPPPPPPASRKHTPRPRKKKGGGCS